MDKKRISGELALLAALLLNSFAVCLMVKSKLGISTISSVPYVISIIFPQLSYGVWMYIYQGLLVILLMFVVKRIYIGYFISFILSVIYGYFIDFFTFLMDPLPMALPFRVLYFCAGFILLSIGICLMIKSNLPVLPFDNIPRDIAEYYNITYKKVKTAFDLICVCVTVMLSLAFLKGIYGVGAGTIIMALITGKVVGKWISSFEKRFYCTPSIHFFEAIEWKPREK